MTEELVSIVLPVYRVEKYIGKCIESILNQDYKNLEVIIVNDGSPDNSCNIAEMLLKGSKIDWHIIHQENKGVSAARNTGIRAAKGEWIALIDADDLIDSSFISELINVVGDNEVVFCDFQLVNLINSSKSTHRNNGIVELTKLDAINYFYYRQAKFIAAGGLYKKSYLTKYNIFFDENCRFSEDVLFIWLILYYLDKIIWLRKPLYNYIYHENSTMTSSDTDKILTGYSAVKSLYSNIYINLDSPVEVKKYFVQRWVFGALHASSRMMELNDFKSLCDQMNYKRHLTDLIKGNDLKISIICIAFKLSVSLGYCILRIA